MFTGIIEEVGTVKHISVNSSGSRLAISGNIILSDLKPGDSVAVNGVCLTADNIIADTFAADIMPETLSNSSLGKLSPGSRVNLERAMYASGRFGGHIVSGHIDGTGTIFKVTKDGNAVRIRVIAASSLLRYIIKKGSITVDGVSLTVTDVGDSDFGVSVIPHTCAETTLLERRPGDTVNLENDIVAKYIERFLLPKIAEGSSMEKKSGHISLEFLLKHGF